MTLYTFILNPERIYTLAESKKEAILKLNHENVTLKTKCIEKNLREIKDFRLKNYITNGRLFKNNIVLMRIQEDTYLCGMIEGVDKKIIYTQDSLIIGNFKSEKEVAKEYSRILNIPWKDFNKHIETNKTVMVPFTTEDGKNTFVEPLFYDILNGRSNVGVAYPFVWNLSMIKDHYAWDNKLWIDPQGSFFNVDQAVYVHYTLFMAAIKEYEKRNDIGSN